MKKITVLIADDSALMRRSLRNIIESDPSMEVVGAARDGADAVEKARQLKPDVVTMDINMPKMDGLTALQIIVDERLSTVLMVSSLTHEGAEKTFEAIELGAFDYVGKPGGTVSANIDSVTKEIKTKIIAAGSYRPGRKTKRVFRVKSRETAIFKTVEKNIVGTEKKSFPGIASKNFMGVAIGISTGGPRTIMEVLPLLPSNLNAAVFLVQHMPPGFTSSFARRVNENCQIECMEAEAGLVVEPGTVYLGKGGYQMTLYKKASGEIILRTPSIPSHTFMPSVDVMMASVLKAFGTDTVGVIMTGMGNDGAESMLKIKQGGGITIAESEESSVVFGMPKSAIDVGGVDNILPSWDIADAIIEAVGIRSI